jgi:hypothetical protein
MARYFESAHVKWAASRCLQKRYRYQNSERMARVATVGVVPEARVDCLYERHEDTSGSPWADNSKGIY